MIKPIRIDCGGRMIEFFMDLDSGFVADNSIGWYLQRGIPPEPEVAHLMMRVVQEGDMVIDAGANVGFFTLLLSQCVGESGKVLAIEPGANNLPKLISNIAQNKLRQNIVICPFMLAAQSGMAQFHLSHDTGINAAWQADHTISTSEIETTKLDCQCDETPRLIKLDIEGSEMEALKGAEKLLQRHPPFVIAELNVGALKAMGTSPEDLRQFMFMRGYEMFVLSEHGMLPAMVPRFSRINVTRNNTNVLFSTSEDIGKAWAEVVV